LRPPVIIVADMTTKATLLTLALFTLGWLACNGQKRSTADDQRFGSPTDSLFFSLERTPCFGKCAAYTVNIYRSGFAEYIGRSNAPRQGRHTGTVPRTTLTALLDQAEAIDYFGLQDTYDGPVTDLPSTITRIVSGDRDKRIVARYKTPPPLKAFAQQADTLLKDVMWVPAVSGQ
jgi:hypothetical protein